MKMSCDKVEPYNLSPPLLWYIIVDSDEAHRYCFLQIWDNKTYLLITKTFSDSSK